VRLTRYIFRPANRIFAEIIGLLQEKSEQQGGKKGRQMCAIDLTNKP
jgi:hypothetical protein